MNQILKPTPDSYFERGGPPVEVDLQEVPGNGGAPLDVRFLGPFAATWYGNPIQMTKQARHVFAYLAFHYPRKTGRDRLAQVFWPDKFDYDPKGALHSLDVEICNIRKALGSMEGEVFSIQLVDNLYELKIPGGMHKDVDRLWRLNQEVQQCLRNQKEVPEGWWQEAVQTFRNPFMEGVSAERYNWIGAERHRIGTICESLCECYSEKLCREGEYWAAIEIGSIILEQDPRIESIHRRLMYCYGKLGKRHKVLEQYKRCAAVLEAEFEAKPSQQTKDMLDAFYRE